MERWRKRDPNVHDIQGVGILAHCLFPLFECNGLFALGNQAVRVGLLIRGRGGFTFILSGGGI